LIIGAQGGGVMLREQNDCKLVCCNLTDKQDRIGDNEEMTEGRYDEVSVGAFKMAGGWCRSE
jgi:hypothetical protein